MSARLSTALALGVATAFAALSGPSAASTAPAMTFSDRCPIDVIFPIWVEPERAREFVPPNYSMPTDRAGRVLTIVSLVQCEDTVVNGVAHSSALYSDLLIQVAPPPGGGTAPVDHQFDAYWAWLITDEPAVQAGLARIGSAAYLDLGMSVTSTRAPVDDRLLSLDGRVAWEGSPFEIHADVLDVRPAGIPSYANHFWHNVPDGRMRAVLRKLPPPGGAVAEQGRLANFTLTTPSHTPLARLLGDLCEPSDDRTSCMVTGGGFVTELPRFEYDITVLGDTAPDPAPAGKPHLAVRPRTLRAGERRRVRFHASLADSARRAPLAGAEIRFAGRRLRTNARGKASAVVRLRRPGARVASMTTPDGRTVTRKVRVTRATRQGDRA